MLFCDNYDLMLIFPIDQEVDPYIATLWIGLTSKGPVSGMFSQGTGHWARNLDFLKTCPFACEGSVYDKIARKKEASGYKSFKTISGCKYGKVYKTSANLTQHFTDVHRFVVFPINDTKLIDLSSMAKKFNKLDPSKPPIRDIFDLYNPEVVLMSVSKYILFYLSIFMYYISGT